MSTRFKGLLSAQLDRAQDLEDMLFELRAGLFLDQAIGAQLDLLGRVYNESRQGRSDADYRTGIRVKAATVVNGTPDEICVFLKLAFGFTSVAYTPEYPGAFFIEPPGTLTVRDLERISPAGIGAYPADYLVTCDEEYLTTTTDEKIMVVGTSGMRAGYQDTLDDTLNLLQDTLGGTSDTILDYLEF